jgi:cell division protein FtsA
MNKSRLIAGVDIGSSKITTLIAQVVTEELTLESSVNIIGVANLPSRGVKKGQIVDIEEAVEALISSVEAAERMAGFNLDRAFISVGGAHVTSQNSKGVVAVSSAEGEVTDEDIARVIDAARAVSHPASREIIHVIPREFIVDGESGVRDPVGMSGVRLEVETHIVTASSAALKNLSKSVNEVGIEVEEMVFAGLASSFATITPTEKELGCVLVDIGAGTVSIAAFVDGALAYSGSLPVGARNVTNDLAIGLRVSLDNAEKIKLSLNKQSKLTDSHGKEIIEVEETGSEEPKKISKRTITEGIIKPRLNEMFSMVKSELDKAGLINKIPSGAIITGGGAMTLGIEEAAKKILSLPTRVANPEGVRGLVDDIGDPRFSTAVGLILYGLSHSSEAPKRKSLPSLPKKIKLPGGGGNVLSKIIGTIRDLLP